MVREGRVEEWEGLEGEGSEEEGRRGKKKGWMGAEGREGDFQMFEILTASVLCSANMCHQSKFCADRSNRCGYMAVFQFFKIFQDFIYI